MLYVVIAVLAAYLLGSISFAVIFGKLFTKKDVRSYGSGNAGMTNVMRVAGVVPGILTFVCDAAKSYVSCFLGEKLFSFAIESGSFFTNDINYASYGAWLCGLVCLLGHIFPLYFRFKGGKGVASGLGVLIYCAPLAVATCLIAFCIVMLCTGIISASSITAVVVAVATVLIRYNIHRFDIILSALIVAVGSIIIIKHKDNIKRLINGEEKKLKVKK